MNKLTTIENAFKELLSLTDVKQAFNLLLDNARKIVEGSKMTAAKRIVENNLDSIKHIRSNTDFDPAINIDRALAHGINNYIEAKILHDRMVYISENKGQIIFPAAAEEIDSEQVKRKGN